MSLQFQYKEWVLLKGVLYIILLQSLNFHSDFEVNLFVYPSMCSALCRLLESLYE